MPALNFQARFAPAVESGTKTQTIRAFRKDGRDPKVGDRLYLYTGMRTKGCRKLGEGLVEVATRIEIRRGFLTVGDGVDEFETEHSIAERDGFPDPDGLRAFFEQTHGLPFTGLLIRWRLER